MAKLGADFNASKPTEADFVRHPSKPNLAAEIRSIRARLKSFFGTTMNLESGDFQDNIIPQAALVDHPDKPDSGGDFYTEVTVDSRGFITKGSKSSSITTARVFRAVFTIEEGVVETETGLVREPAPNTSSWPINKLKRNDERTIPEVREYRFFAPAKVTQIKIRCIGGGMDGSATVPGANGKTCWMCFPVTPGAQYRVLVGLRQFPSAFCSTDYLRYMTSEGWTYNVIGGGADDKDNIYLYKRPLYRPYGFGGAINQPGNPGIVHLEWYA